MCPTKVEKRLALLWLLCYNIGGKKEYSAGAYALRMPLGGKST